MQNPDISHSMSGFCIFFDASIHDIQSTLFTSPTLLIIMPLITTYIE